MIISHLSDKINGLMTKNRYRMLHFLNIYDILDLSGISDQNIIKESEHERNKIT